MQTRATSHLVLEIDDKETEWLREVLRVTTPDTEEDNQIRKDFFYACGGKSGELLSDKEDARVSAHLEAYRLKLALLKVEEGKKLSPWEEKLIEKETTQCK